MKEAVSNARLWEARFGAADKSRQEYRENAKKLISQNDRLQTAVDQVSQAYCIDYNSGSSALH